MVGLKSPYSPRQVKEAYSLWKWLSEIIRNMKFRKITNTFQEKLKEDIKLSKNQTK